MNIGKPVIFLTFANDQKGRFLEALRPEQDGINLELARFQREYEGIVYNSASSGPNKILEGLNQFSGQLIIFHFSGHSDGQRIQLESLQGEQILLNGENLTSLLFGEAKENLKLVFLNACLTKGMLKAFERIGVPAIIATSESIPDDQAKDFAIAFYRSLASGNTLETAFNQSKGLIEGEIQGKGIYRFRGFEQENPKVTSPWGLFVQENEVLNWKIADAFIKETGNDIPEESFIQKSSIGRYLSVIALIIGILGSFAEFMDFINIFPPQSNNLFLELEVTDVSGNVVLENEGRLKIQVGNQFRNESIGTNGKTVFPNIPHIKKGDSLKIGLDAEGWEIVNESNLFLFTGKAINVKVKRDNSLGSLRGRVIVDDVSGSGPGEGFLVDINGDTAIMTNDIGLFDITLPNQMRINDEEEGYLLTISKKGYETTTQYVYPNSSKRSEIEINKISKGDIIISSLTSKNRLVRLPGFPIIQISDTSIFTNGFRLRLSLIHNRKSNEPIKILGIRTVVDDFIPGENSKYDYTIDLDEIIGRGTKEVQTFSVTLNGQKLNKSYWVDEKGNPQISNSWNLLDIDPPQNLTLLNTNEDVGEELDITVKANTVGFYVVHFSIEYFIAGEDRVKNTKKICLYKKNE